MTNERKNERIDYSKTFENDLEMLKYFQEEFQYRHKHYWSLLIKLFTLTIGITILPVASGVFGIELHKLPRDVLMCFPIMGLILCAIGKILLYDEAKKMSAVNRVKYRINNQLMDPKYRYEIYNKSMGDSFSKEAKQQSKKYHKWMSFYILILLTVLEVLIIAYVLYVMSLLTHTVTL